MKRERVAQKNSFPDDRQRELAEAMDLMCKALELLDLHNAPGEIGAHLDLAICRLREYLNFSPAKTGSQ